MTGKEDEPEWPKAALQPEEVAGPHPPRAVQRAMPQGPVKHTNVKEYCQEAGFGILPAVPGRRTTFHD